MKIYSYQEEKEQFLDLKEISIVARVKDLSAIVKFFQKAIELQESENNYDYESHIHLQDEWQEWNDSFPDIVIQLKEEN
jgi:hypothetical protein